MPFRVGEQVVHMVDAERANTNPTYVYAIGTIKSLPHNSNDYYEIEWRTSDGRGTTIDSPYPGNVLIAFDAFRPPITISDWYQQLVE